jgi:UDP-GlcNAc:undecaprenyl-phosphate/decaprenyl-phosphate GlcNAc-1-phosphate transferase
MKVYCMVSEIRIVSPLRIVAAAFALCLLLPRVRMALETTLFLKSLHLLLLSFLLCFVIMPLCISFGKKLGLIDAPDEERKKHTTPTPLTGGIAIFVSFVATILLNFHFSVEVKAILFSSSLIFIIGLIDDRWGVPANLRLIVQLVASLIIVYFGVRVTFVPDWLGGVVTETIITVLWFIGITNSMNFIDGMDGLAAGSAIIYSFFFAIIAIITRQSYMMLLSVAIAGSCAGFMIFNFRRGKPALVFLGDSGSTFLGFLLGSFAILGNWGDSIIDIVIPVLIMSVLIFDMTLTTVLRIYKKEVRNFTEWVRYTGRDHFHHRLAGLGITKAQSTMIFFGISICFGVEALAILFADVLVSILMLLHSILTFIIFGLLLVLPRNKRDTRKIIAVNSRSKG